ncbi:MAG: AraC family transcriptional regulator [Candidatus Promineifilaceae bacterium]|nr:AraC family transcriptional regulator [Candidatus Promineifilaceae bacterium]
MLEEVKTSRDWLFSSDYKILRLPRAVIESLENKHALLANFFATNIGFFTKVYGHYTRRTNFDEYMVIYCLDGNGWYECNGQHWDIGIGQALFVLPGLAHAYGSYDRDPWSIQWAHFRGYLASSYMELIGITPQKPLCTIGIHPLISNLFSDALTILTSGYSVFHLVKMASQIQQALSHIAFSTAYAPPKGSMGLHVNEVIEYMLANLTERCTLDDFAQQACLSRSYFSRQFRDKTGYAPVDYFIRLKMQRSCELLETTHMTVGQISRSLGYQDQYYFSRIFKKIIGVHPTRYRKMQERNQ